jgi:hypothetical protein
MSTEAIIGALVAFIGTGIFWLASDIRARQIRLEAKIDKKMDIEDHEKQAELCVRTLTEKLNDAWMGFKERFSRNEKCIMDHTHDETTGRTILKGGL